MSIIPAEPRSAVYTTTGSQAGIIAHVIDFDEIERDFLNKPPEILAMHIKEIRIVVTEYLQLVLFSISAAAIAKVYFTNILKEMAFILCSFSSYGIMKQKGMMTMVFVQFPEFHFIPGSFHMVTGIMIHEFNVMFVQLFTNIRIISVQPSEII